MQLCALCTRCHLWGGMGSESLIWICLFKYFFLNIQMLQIYCIHCQQWFNLILLLTEHPKFSNLSHSSFLIWVFNCAKILKILFSKSSLYPENRAKMTEKLLWLCQLRQRLLSGILDHWSNIQQIAYSVFSLSRFSIVPAPVTQDHFYSTNATQDKFFWQGNLMKHTIFLRTPFLSSKLRWSSH